MARRGRQGAGAETPANVPVVVTVDGQRAVLDIVGDLGRFTDPQEDTSHTVQRLLDLLEGEGDAPDLIPAIELAPGRFADIHVVVEDDCRHFVLIDVSDMMQALRQRQQSGNELALAQHRERRASAAHGDARGEALAQPRFRGASALGSVISGMRMPLLQLAAQVRLLERHCAGDPAALTLIAGIQQAGAQLDGWCANALFAFDERAPAVVSLANTDALAAFVLDTFQLVARMQGVTLQLRVPEQAQPLDVDSALLRQVLLNLLLHALDGLSEGTLVLAVSGNASRASFDIELACEPAGFDASRFAELVTKAGLVGSTELALCRAALMQMKAKLELVERVTGGFDLWCRVPFIDQGATP